MSHEDALYILPTVEGQEHTIQPLFRSVFKSDIDPALLHWKYGEGRGKSWGGWSPDGQLIVHCGVFYRHVLAGGNPRRVAQLGDLMAARRKQGGLSRQHSPFHRLISRVLADIPAADNPDAVCFGFPSERAMRLGERLKVFATIDQMHELSFLPVTGRLPADCVTPAPTLTPRLARLIDRLWKAMARDLNDTLVGVRNAEYVGWRYFAHPAHRYTCCVVRSRWTRRILGAIVVRGDGAERELMDIIAPLHRFPRILVAVRQWLARTGGQRLTLWLASTHARCFGPLAQSCAPLEFRIMANPQSPDWLLRRFHRRWWLTSGDTDYR